MQLAMQLSHNYDPPSSSAPEQPSAFAAAGAADSDVGAMSTPGGGSSIASPNGGYRV